MFNFLDGLVRYWPIITWFLGMVFTMGVMWVKIETSQRAFRKLFDETDKLRTFKDGQEVQNNSFKDTMRTFADEARAHREEDSKKFSETMTQINQLYRDMIASTKGAH